MKNNLPPIKLRKEDAIRIETGKHTKFRTTPYKIHIFKCGVKECQNEIRIWPGKEKEATGYCTSCLRKKRPFGLIYNRIRWNADRKKQKVSLTYKEFLEFTKIECCTYCQSRIVWEKHAVNGSNAHSYNLDRKDAAKEYSKENCVVCCRICNWAKNSLFSHEEFLIIGKAIRRVLKARKQEKE